MEPGAGGLGGDQRAGEDEARLDGGLRFAGGEGRDEEGEGGEAAEAAHGMNHGVRPQSLATLSPFCGGSVEGWPLRPYGE